MQSMMDFMKVDKEYNKMNTQETTIIGKTMQVWCSQHSIAGVWQKSRNLGKAK
jgi:hypothetical protein